MIRVSQDYPGSKFGFALDALDSGSRLSFILSPEEDGTQAQLDVYWAEIGKETVVYTMTISDDTLYNFHRWILNMLTSEKDS